MKSRKMTLVHLVNQKKVQKAVFSRLLVLCSLILDRFRSSNSEI